MCAAKEIWTFIPLALEEVAVPLVAVFTGAWLAFIKERKIRHTEKEEADKVAAHELMFVFSQQRQILGSLQTKVAEQVQEVVKRSIMVTLNNITIDLTRLGFMCRRAPAELNYVMIAERAYLQALDVLADFNRAAEVLSDTLQRFPAQIDSSNNIKARSGDSLHTIVIKKALDCADAALRELQQAASDSVEKQQIAYRKLRGYLVQRWPSWKLPPEIDSAIGDYDAGVSANG